MSSGMGRARATMDQASRGETPTLMILGRAHRQQAGIRAVLKSELDPQGMPSPGPRLSCGRPQISADQCRYSVQIGGGPVADFPFLDGEGCHRGVVGT